MSLEIVLTDWGGMHDARELRRRREELGSRAFARGFQQNALSDAERLFPHFEDCIDRGATAWDIVTREWTAVAGVDLAGKSRRGTCIVVLAVSPDQFRCRTPVSVEFGAWNSTAIVERIVGAIRGWNVVHTKIEDNSLQDTIIEMIELVAPTLEVAGFTTSWNKRDPDIGLPSLDREFQKGLWKIPDPHAEREICNCDYCLWLRQMKSYPAVENADGVMAAWFAREAAKELGPGLGELGDFNTSPGESRWELDGASRFGPGARSFRWAPGGRPTFTKKRRLA